MKSDTKKKKWTTTLVVLVGSNFLGNLWKLILVLRLKWFKNSAELNFTKRLLIAESCGKNPLGQENHHQTPIEVFIPCTAKDFDLLPLAIHGVRQHCQNEISRITVVTKEEDINPILPLISNLEVTVASENDLMDQGMLSAVNDLIPESRRGWVMKQILSFYCSSNSSSSASLILDADTILLKPRTFIKGQLQILFPVGEYNQYDQITTQKTWPNALSCGISFTAHHLVIQRDLINNMLSEWGTRKKTLEKWLKSTNAEKWLPLSDMHAYGTWTLNNHPSRIRFARWGNKRVSRARLPIGRNSTSPENFLDLASKQYPKSYSISLHHYLDTNFEGNE